MREQPGTETAAGPRVRPGVVAVVPAAVAIGGFLLLRRLLSPFGLGGLAVAEWFALFGVPVAWMVGRGGGLKELLRVGGGGPASPQRPTPVDGASSRRGWAAALLTGCAGIPVVWFVTWLQGDWLPPDPSVTEGLRRQLLAGDGVDLLILLAGAAVTPAICEELVFRGTLLDGLLTHWPPRSAVVFSGLAFGLLHWVPGGAFRILPTAAVGVVLGWLAWRTGSVLHAMLAHGIHNALVLVTAAWTARSGGGVAWGVVGDEALPPPLWLLLAGVAILWWAHHLLHPGSGGTRTP